MDGHTYLKPWLAWSSLGAVLLYVLYLLQHGAVKTPSIDGWMHLQEEEDRWNRIPSPLLNSVARMKHTYPLLSRSLLCLSVSLSSLRAGSVWYPFLPCHTHRRILEVHEKLGQPASPPPQPHEEKAKEG